ncbi:MAG: threonylcarbamoyl-AMP synthase [Proteobacteria bacterium]|nr:threonylcarbamoyl-AMP synthase [Pseudomonadota bacterium]
MRAAIEEAASVISAGGVVALPTESFYGLAVDAMNEKAIERLIAIKRRRDDNPILILLPSREVLPQYVAAIPDVAMRLMDHFWPGGLTMVFEAKAGISPLLTAGTGKIGVRLSSHPLPTELARLVGAAITGTSANRSGQPPCTSAQEVMDAIGDDIDLILDGGRTQGGKGSTVLDLTVDPPLVVREGMVGRETLAPFLWKSE